MIGDVWTVMRKEWTEFLNQGSSRFGVYAGAVFMVAFLGVGVPLFTGRGWLGGGSGGGSAYGVFFPVFVVTPIVADAFAGERERRTLETLLASRLSDRAILLGKVGAAVAAGWGLIVFSRALGLLSLNLVLRQGEILWPTGGWWAATGASMAIRVYVAGVGTLVSLRAPTVKQATQGMLLVALAPLLLLVVAGFLLFSALSALPDSMTDPIGAALGAGGWIPLAILGVLAALLLPLVPLLLTMRRFKRARLLLD